jgi:hypothetical protein
MPYELKDKNGAIGVGEALWADGHEPFLWFHDALWTATTAVAEDVRCIADIPSDTVGSALARVIQAEWRWEEAYCAAVLERELTDVSPRLAEAIRKALEELDPDDDMEGEEGDPA